MCPGILARKGGSMEPLEPWLNPPLITGSISKMFLYIPQCMIYHDICDATFINNSDDKCLILIVSSTCSRCQPVTHFY